MPRIRAVILSSTLFRAVIGLTLHAAEPAETKAPAAPLAGADLLHQLDDAYTALFRKVAPAVVIIDAPKKPATDEQEETFDFNFRSPEGADPAHPRPPQPLIRSEGSGFIVRPDGYIYTNFHVVEDAEKIQVRLRDNRRFVARLVGADERTDIAVLKIDATDLPAVSFVDSESVQIGQTCFAIGIPYDMEYSFCRGIVSGKDRGNLTGSATKPMYEDYIQTDAFINPGNSGGPLFDSDGRVMGMNTLTNGIGRGLSFAIPSNMLADVGSELIANGKVVHPWLGITVRSLSEELDNAPASADRFHGIDQGVCVETIEANAPAYKSDLRPMDIITKVDNLPVTSTQDLQGAILHKKIGQSVELAVWRGGKTFQIPIVTEALPADLTGVKEAHGRAKIHPSDSTTYGLQFAPPQGEGKRKAAGVVIAAVDSNSPGSRADIRPGDIVTHIDGKPVTDPEACLALLAAHRGPAGPALSIERAGAASKTILDTNGDN